MWVWGCWFLYGLYIIVLEIVFNECRIVLCACYLSPETSTWGMDADLYFNHLSSVVQSLDEVDFIIGAGDLNARIGSKTDFIPDIDVVCTRHIIDEISNKHGESFLEFLTDNQMSVLNGRFKGSNDFTCIRTQGRSVVDYGFTTHEGFQYVNNFYVKRVKEILNDMSLTPSCAIPDHSVLITDVNFSHFNNMQLLHSNSEKLEPYSYAKEYYFKDISSDFMNNDLVNRKMEDIIKRNGQIGQPQAIINDMYNDFLSLLNNEMAWCLTKVKKHFGNIHKKYCPFWNETLGLFFKAAAKAEKDYCKCLGNSQEGKRLHLDFKKKQQDFDVAFRKAKRIYARQNEIEIESMVNVNDNDMWKKIEQLGPQFL